MFKKFLLLSLLVPFMAQSVEITNNSSKIIGLSCYTKDMVQIDDIKNIAPNTTVTKTDVSMIIVSYSYNDKTHMWQDEFHLRNLTDESKISFTDDNAKISAFLEENGQKFIVQSIGLE